MSSNNYGEGFKNLINERNISINDSLKFNLEKPIDMVIVQEVFGYAITYEEKGRITRIEDQPQKVKASIQLLHSLKENFNSYISNIELDYTDYYTGMKSFRKASMSYKILDKELIDIMESHTKKNKMRDVVSMITFRELGKLAYRNGLYKLALDLNSISIGLFYLNSRTRNNRKDYFQEMLSEQNKQKSLGYWAPRNEEKEQLRAKYLRIMKEQGFTKYTDAAEYIYAESNPEKKKYRFIYDALREADK